MNRRGWLLSIVCGLTSHVALAQATIEGRVELPRAHAAPVVTQRYEIISKGGALAPSPPLAIVYLEGATAHPSSLPTRQVTQKNLAFQPALLPVQVGTRVEFPNLDDTYHNIFSYSPAKRFDLGRYRPDERPIPSQLFDKPGLVTLRCDIHEHMRGLILVLETPYFVITDTSGNFRLSGISPGHYLAKAWLDSRTTRQQPVELREGELHHLDFK